MIQRAGPERQPILNANDGQIPIILGKIIKLCTTELIELMQEVDQITATVQIDEEKKRDMKDKIEEMIELNYVDPLYGRISNLNHEYWGELQSSLKRVGKVWFDSQQLRMLTFTRMDIETEETEEFKKFC